jgi:senataxin
MHPEICLFPNTAFYEGQLINAPSVAVPSPWHAGADGTSSGFPPFAFFNLRGREGRTSTGSSTNSAEAVVATAIVRSFLQEFRESCQPERVGIITPYRLLMAAMLQVVLLPV